MVDGGEGALREPDHSDASSHSPPTRQSLLSPLCAHILRKLRSLRCSARTTGSRARRDLTPHQSYGMLFWVCNNSAIPCLVSTTQIPQINLFRMVPGSFKPKQRIRPRMATRWTPATTRNLSPFMLTKSLVHVCNFIAFRKRFVAFPSPLCDLIRNFSDFEHRVWFLKSHS
ncbi:hypothetical protein BC830DRAFT_274190 [Chytriomyces sp. MP71]|nr:hypothetical protein BC830DRAFT_274190 [Chytriomyces sp. MP71]